MSTRATVTAPLDAAALGTVLGVWAHPDDEVFCTGGLLGRLTDAGQHVTCLTATRGELGTADPDSWPPARLGRRRERELRASLSVVGVTDHELLDHHDGTLRFVDPEPEVARIAATIDRLRPDTVVTFGPDGLTGHTDHVTVSRWTTAACALATHATRLLHVTTTRAYGARFAATNLELGAFAPGLPFPADDADLALRMVLDDDELDRKTAALAVQASQMGPLIDRLGEDTFAAWVAEEAFVLAPSSRVRDVHGPAAQPVTVAVWPREAEVLGPFALESLAPGSTADARVLVDA